MSTIITRYFPAWAILVSVIAYLYPALFSEMKSLIIPLLVVIMLAMGMTLTFDDFKRVSEKPLIIVLAISLQFIIMPATAFVLSVGLELPVALMTGMLLVGVSSGGTASNVICYLAKGDVALSITLTLCSTLIAVIAIPLLTLLYLGEKVPVPAMAMLWTVLKIVLIPVIAGVLVNHYFGIKIEKIKMAFPVVSVLAIILIIAIIVALNQSKFHELGKSLLIAVVLHNLAGLIIGYWVMKWLGYNKKQCRTVAIEVGMQNSGLSVALAIKYFSPLAALPGAIFSIWHNVSGSILASIWSRKE